MNKKIYIWTIVISLLLLIPACIWNCNIMQSYLESVVVVLQQQLWQFSLTWHH